MLHISQLNNLQRISHYTYLGILAQYYGRYITVERKREGTARMLLVRQVTVITERNMCYLVTYNTPINH